MEPRLSTPKEAIRVQQQEEDSLTFTKKIKENEQLIATMLANIAERNKD